MKFEDGDSFENLQRLSRFSIAPVQVSPSDLQSVRGQSMITIKLTLKTAKHSSNNAGIGIKPDQSVTIAAVSLISVVMPPQTAELLTKNQ